MRNESQQIPPRNPTWFAYLFGIVGLLLLNGSADSLAHHRPGPTGWILLVSGVGAGFGVVVVCEARVVVDCVKIWRMSERGLKAKVGRRLG